MLDCPVLACPMMFLSTALVPSLDAVFQGLSPGELLQQSERGFDSQINLNPSSSLTTTHLLYFSGLQFPQLQNRKG